MTHPWIRTAPAVFLLAWGGNHFTPLLHMYESLGGYAPWQANLLLGMYVFGLIPGLLGAATLSNTFGRKPLMYAGVLAACAASSLLALGLSSFVLLCIGRVLAGIGVGVAMSVGSSWIKELSGVPYDVAAARTTGARRASLTLTLGFGIGAAVTGVLAQWGPTPGQTPYLLHLALGLLSCIALIHAPETVSQEQRGVARSSWSEGFQLRAVKHRTFTRAVLPLAPWVFAAAGVAYAIMPRLVESQLGDYATLFATVLTVITLGAGALIQLCVPWLNAKTGGRSPLIGLAAMTLGMGLAALVSAHPYAPAVFVIAVILGCAYGICLVSGLTLVQSIATPRELAGMTGIYYSLTYLGFLLPTVLAIIDPVIPATPALITVAALSALSFTVVAREMRRGR